ncbi:MAG: portal protein [Pseudomonadota bacterium]
MADTMVKELRELFEHDAAADRENREAMLDDLEAYSGKGQWDYQDKQAREAENRPTLEQNQLPRFARQTIGDLREAEPSIKIVPDGDGADEEMATLHNGIARQIQKRAAGTKPITQAAEMAVICGIGNFRIATRYLRDNPFHQDICLEPIHSPLAVVWDADAREVTRQDAQHVFIREVMTRGAFKKKYPKAGQADFSDTTQDVTRHFEWSSKDTVTVAECFRVEMEKAQYVLLPGGEVLRLDRLPKPLQWDEASRMIGNPQSDEGTRIVDLKEADARKVVWRKMTGEEVLDERDWLTADIPVIAVVGEQIHFHDRVQRVSLIRYAKGAQKIYNYAVNAMVEVAMNAPKSPYLLGASQLPQGEMANLWLEANKGTKPFLLYDDSKNATKPQREPPPPMQPALMQMVAQSAEDLRGTTGVNESALGNPDNATSGVAIANRQRESDIGTNVFGDNLEASLYQAGRVIIDLIPRVYDSQRMLRIAGEDGTESQVVVNREVTEGGRTIVQNDLQMGRYDLAVSIGPSATTRRQEALQAIERVLAGSPEMLANFIDFFIEAVDAPGKEKWIERARKVLPPEMQEQPEDDPEAMQAAEAAQQMQERDMQRQEAMADAAVQKATAEATEATAQASEAQAAARKEMIEAALAEFRAMLEQGQIDGVLQSRMMQLSQPQPVQ